MPINFRYFLLAICFLATFYSCSNRPDNVLSRNEMTDFLVEIHKLDGALNAKGLGSYDNRQNVYYYNALLKKHGISKAQFDSSLVWYTKNPKKFERIYVDVVEQLTKLDEKVKNGFYHPVDTAALRNIHENIWPLTRTKFDLTKDSVPAKISFTIKSRQLACNDTYKFSFLHRSGKSNTAKDQKTIIRIHYSGKKTDSIVCKTANDSILRHYTITLIARRQLRIDSLSGAVLNYSAKKGKFNAYVDSLKLVRRYDSIAQDSIRRVINLIENPIPAAFPTKPELRLRSKIILQRKNELPE